MTKKPIIFHHDRSIMDKYKPNNKNITNWIENTKKQDTTIGRLNKIKKSLTNIIERLEKKKSEVSHELNLQLREEQFKYKTEMTMLLTDLLGTPKNGNRDGVYDDDFIPHWYINDSFYLSISTIQNRVNLFIDTVALNIIADSDEMDVADMIILANTLHDKYKDLSDIYKRPDLLKSVIGDLDNSSRFVKMYDNFFSPDAKYKYKED